MAKTGLTRGTGVLYPAGSFFLPCFLGLCLFLFSFFSFSQIDTNTVLVFDFNDHTFNEKKQQVKTEPVGVTLVEDRFGNKESALYLQGHTNSYFILGRSDLLKPTSGTLSLWVRLERRVYAGRGYEGNPIITTRRSAEEDFYDAYGLFYDFKSDRLMVAFSKDESAQAVLNSIEPMVFNQWLHAVLVYNNDFLTFYINGKKQGEAKKEFTTTFLKNAPVIIGSGDSQKNDRRSRGTVDDIKIFHRALSEHEILDLYNEPNPNKSWLIFTIVMKYLGIAALILLIAFTLVWQRRRSLARVREKLDINRKLHEMEIRTLKAQMNPHFIFNSLNSIQQFIMVNDNEKAQEYLAKFSRLIRNQLESNVNESLSIGEEVEILNGYMEIESLRFNQAFSYDIAVDERLDVSKMRIPHLIVQPFVENAIWHGLLPKKGNRSIWVSFEWVNEKVVRCKVEDNGVGRNMEKTEEHTFKKKSLALSLVRQRLDLLSKTYHTHCEVKIVDKINNQREKEGVIVLIDLPVLNQ